MSEVKRTRCEEVAASPAVVPASSGPPAYTADDIDRAVKTVSTKGKLPAEAPKRVFDAVDTGRVVHVKLSLYDRRITMCTSAAMRPVRKHEARVELKQHELERLPAERRESVAGFLHAAAALFNEAAAKDIKGAYLRLYEDVNLRNIVDHGEPATSGDYDNAKTLVFVRAPPGNDAWRLAAALRRAKNASEIHKALCSVAEFNAANTIDERLAQGYVNTDVIVVANPTYGLAVPRWASLQV